MRHPLPAYITGTDLPISSRMQACIGSLSDAEPLDQCTILLDVVLLDIIEKASALTDHLLKAAARMMILRMLLDVLGELTDALCQNSDLDFG